jgi:hypothetical protein
MFPDSFLIVQRLDLQGFLVRIVCLALERVSSCEWLLSYRMLLSNDVGQPLAGRLILWIEAK